jgi:hypothetical protein
MIRAKLPFKFTELGFELVGFAGHILERHIRVEHVINGFVGFTLLQQHKKSVRDCLIVLALLRLSLGENARKDERNAESDCKKHAPFNSHPSSLQ